MDKKVLIVDHLPEELRGDVHLKEALADKSIVIVDPEPELTIKALEINGIKYKRIQEEDLSSHRGRGSFMKLAAMTMAMGAMMPGMGGAYERKRPYVNIEKEFELIQNKQSNLCRSDRDWVVRTFHSLYEEVK